MGLRIVVTGATGHIGSCLVRRLLEEGHEVVAAARHPKESPALDGLDLEIADVDIRDLEHLKKIFRRADIVYHLAGLIAITPEQYAELSAINVWGSRNVAIAALKCHVKRLIHVSSIHAYSQAPHHEPLDETRHHVQDLSEPAYDRSKAKGEQVVRALMQQEGLDVVIMNPCGVIGPYDYLRSHMGRSLVMMFQNRLPVAVQGGFNWVDVRDVTETLVRGMTAGRSGESYILGGEWASVARLLRLTRKIANQRGAAVPLPWHLAKWLAPLSLKVSLWMGEKSPLFTPDAIHALKCNRFINDEKARNELGHTSRPLEESLRDVYQWWAIQGRLLPELAEMA